MSEGPSLDKLARLVALHRSKGDALTERNRPGAADAYRSAADSAAEALELLGVSDGSEPSPEAASDVAEWLGVRGGLLRRLGELGQADAMTEALECYRRGAKLETGYDLTETYNRGNAVKLALIDHASTLEDERESLADLRDALNRRLTRDEAAADNAWLWADLADALLLLGDEPAAFAAYQTFASKAKTRSKAATLRVLRTLVQTLGTHGDPGAPALERALGTVEAILA